MLRIEYRMIDGEDLACPVFSCSTCGRVIRDAEQASYVWWCDEKGRIEPGIMTLHNGSCIVRMEAARVGYHLLTDDLAALPGRLASSLGLGDSALGQLTNAYQRLADDYGQRPTVPRGGGIKGEINPA